MYEMHYFRIQFPLCKRKRGLSFMNNKTQSAQRHPSYVVILIDHSENKSRINLLIQRCWCCLTVPDTCCHGYSGQCDRQVIECVFIAFLNSENLVCIEWCMHSSYSQPDTHLHVYFSYLSNLLKLYVHLPMKKINIFKKLALILRNISQIILCPDLFKQVRYNYKHNTK